MTFVAERGNTSHNLVKNVPFRECCTSEIAEDFDTSATVGKPASIAALAVLVTVASQSRQHESRKPPTVELFDVDSGRISIVTVNTKEYHSDVLAIITRIMRRTLDNSL
ncbi:hypothetical protein Tco_0498927 [Tanacetum coccineum]